MTGPRACAGGPLDNPSQEQCDDGAATRCRSLTSMIQDLRDVNKVPKRCGKCHHLKFLGDWAVHHDCSSSTCGVPAVVGTAATDSESSIASARSKEDRSLPSSQECGCSACQELIKLHWQHQVAEKISRAPRKCKTCGHHPHLGRWPDLHPKNNPCMVIAVDHSKGKGSGWKELCCPCSECQLHLQQPPV